MDDFIYLFIDVILFWSVCLWIGVVVFHLYI